MNITELLKHVNSERQVKFGRCWIHGTNGHDITDCNSFKSLSNKERKNRWQKS